MVIGYGKLKHNEDKYDRKRIYCSRMLVYQEGEKVSNNLQSRVEKRLSSPRKTGAQSFVNFIVFIEHPRPTNQH